MITYTYHIAASTPQIN